MANSVHAVGASGTFLSTDSAVVLVIESVNALLIAQKFTFFRTGTDASNARCASNARSSASSTVFVVLSKVNAFATAKSKTISFTRSSSSYTLSTIRDFLLTTTTVEWISLIVRTSSLAKSSSTRTDTLSKDAVLARSTSLSTTTTIEHIGEMVNTSITTSLDTLTLTVLAGVVIRANIATGSAVIFIRLCVYARIATTVWCGLWTTSWVSTNIIISTKSNIVVLALWPT